MDETAGSNGKEEEELFQNNLCQHDRYARTNASCSPLLDEVVADDQLRRAHSTGDLAGRRKLTFDKNSPAIHVPQSANPHSISSSSRSSSSSTTSEMHEPPQEYERFDNDEEAASAQIPPSMETLMSSIPRCREFAEQFQDLAQLNPRSLHGERTTRARWEDAERLFPKQFGLSSAAALDIWQRVDEDGDLELTETEYCLASHLATRFATTGFTLLEGVAPFAATSAVTNSPPPPIQPSLSPRLQPRHRIQHHLGVVDNDLLPYVSTSHLLATPEPTDPHTSIDVNHCLSSRRASSICGSLALWKRHPVPLVRSPGFCCRRHSACASTSCQNHHQHTSLSLTAKRNVLATPNMTTLDVKDLTVESVESEEYVEEEEDGEGVGVTALLLPRRSGRQHAPHTRCSSSSSSVSSSSSNKSVGRSSPSSSSSSSYSSSQVSLSSPPSAQLPFPPSTATTTGFLRTPNTSDLVDPVEVLCKVTGCSLEHILNLSRRHQLRILASLVRAAKSTNHTLLRLNNELAGELQELCDQHTNLNAQVRHLSREAGSTSTATTNSAPSFLSSMPPFQ